MTDEDEIPKAGGVKAMLAALNKKNADSHVVLPDGTVPSGGKRPWKPPPKKDAPASGPPAPAAPAPSSTYSSGQDLGDTPNTIPAGTVESSPALKPSPPGSAAESLTQDEMRRVREQVAARRKQGLGAGNAAADSPGGRGGGAPPPPGGRGGPSGRGVPMPGPPGGRGGPGGPGGRGGPPGRGRGGPPGGGRGGAPPPGGRGGAPPPGGREGAPPPGGRGGPPQPGGRGGPLLPGGRGAPPLSSPPAGEPGEGQRDGHDAGPPRAKQLPPPPSDPPPPGTGCGHANLRPQVAALPTGPPEKPLPESAVHVEAAYPGVGHYSGAVKGSKRHGRGLFRFENGDSYRGEWKEGQMHGYGEYHWKGGCKYTGDWEDGKHEGRGFMSWGEDGQGTSAKAARYTGSFKHGFRTGLGSESIPGHGVYAGEWQADKRAGRGTFKWDNGNTYDGEWAADQRSGIGLFVWANGRRFEGRFDKDFPREGLRSEPDGTSLAVTFDPHGEYEIERDPHPMESSVVGRRDYTGPRYSAGLDRTSPARVSPGGSRVTLPNVSSTYVVDPGAQPTSGVLNARVRQIGFSSNALEEYDQKREAMQRAKNPPPTTSPLNSAYIVRGPSPTVASSTYIPLSGPVNVGDATVNHLPLRHFVQTPVAGIPVSEPSVADAPTPVSSAPPAPSVRAVGRPVAIKLKLSLDFDSAVGSEGSDLRASFDKDLCQDLANATDLPTSSFVLKKLSRGSVIVDLDIRPDLGQNSPDPFAAAGELAEQASKPGSKLRTGKITRSLEAISFPSLKPGPMTPVHSAPAAKKSPEPRVITPNRTMPSIEASSEKSPSAAMAGTNIEPQGAFQSEPTYTACAPDCECDHCHVKRLERRANQLAKELTGKEAQLPGKGLSPAQPLASRSLYVSAPGRQPDGELGLAIARVPEGIVVSDKKTGSPAAYSQRIRVGDRIHKVDNVVVEQMDVAQVRQLLRGAPYTSVQLELVSTDTGASYACALQRAEATGWSSRDPTPFRHTPEPAVWDSVREAALRSKGEVGGDATSVRTAGSQYGGDATSWLGGIGGLFPSLDIRDLSLNIFNNRERSAPSTPTLTARSTLPSRKSTPKATPDLMPRVIHHSSVLAGVAADPMPFAGQGSSAPPMSPQKCDGASSAGDIERVPSFPNSVSAQTASQSTTRPIGLLLKRHAHSKDPDAVIIDNIMPNSVADRSRPQIMRGDELVAVSGVQVRHLPLGQVRTMMASDDVYPRLMLKLKRGDMLYDTQLAVGNRGLPLTDMPAQILKVDPAAAQRSGGAFDVFLKLGLDIGAAGVEGSRWREGFLQDLRQDLATASELAPENFEIKRLSPGSIIVDAMIHGLPDRKDGREVVQSLARQVHDPTSVLRAGVITRFIEAIEIAESGDEGGGKAAEVAITSPTLSAASLASRTRSFDGSLMGQDLGPVRPADPVGAMSEDGNSVHVPFTHIVTLSPRAGEPRDLRGTTKVIEPLYRSMPDAKPMPARTGPTIGMLLKRHSADPDTVVVASIAPGGLADQSGKVAVGDTITAVNGVNVRSLPLSKVSELMANRDHKALRLDMLREGKPNQVIIFWQQPSPRDVTATNQSSGSLRNLYSSAPGARVPSGVQAYSGPMSGVGLKIEQSSDGRFVVSKIKPGSNADMTGVFKEGDQVMAVGEDGVQGKSLEWVKSKILGKPATTVLLTMLREGRPYTMVVVREGSRPSGESKMAYGYPSPPPRHLTTSSPLRHADTYTMNATSSPVKILEAPGYKSPGAFESVLMGVPPSMGGPRMGVPPSYQHPPSTGYGLLHEPATSLQTSPRIRQQLPNQLASTYHLEPPHRAGGAAANHVINLSSQLYSPPGNSRNLSPHFVHAMNLSSQLYSPSDGSQHHLLLQSQSGHVSTLASQIWSPEKSPTMGSSADPLAIAGAGPVGAVGGPNLASHMVRANDNHVRPEKPASTGEPKTNFELGFGRGSREQKTNDDQEVLYGSGSSYQSTLPEVGANDGRTAPAGSPMATPQATPNLTKYKDPRYPNEPDMVAA